MTKNKYVDQISNFVRRLGDVRFAGQVLFVVIVLMISWSGIKAIQMNYGLQKQISQLEQQNKLQKLRNDNLTLQNDYFNSDQYLELSARQNFGLGAPGEKEVVVSEQVALANTVNLPGPAKQTDAEATKPAYQRNFESWVNFFLHRQNQAN
ncbi:MAG TPA: septum formation initiator family protein [Methylomirabilota bacterium]|nr:septum formation initiator family protein [Methylomirabilota bacterium]